MNFQEKLAGVVNRYDEVQALLSSPGLSADELVKLNKEISTLEPVVVEPTTNSEGLKEKVCSVCIHPVSVYLLQ